MPLSLAILLIVISGLSGAGIMWVFIGFNFRLKALEAEKRRRDQVAVDSRGRMRQHHSYSTIDGLEDAMALLIEHAMNLDAEVARSQTTLAILQTLRKGPYSYGQDHSTDEK